MSESKSQSESTSDLPDFIPSHLIESEPFFDRRSAHQDPVAPVREGLPATYRMRADAHYVDQLIGPPSGPAVHVLKASALELPEPPGVTPPAALVTSIGRHNVLQPLLVQRWRGRYRVIDGRKRLAAAIAAGLSEVPCLLHDVDDAGASMLAQAANVSLQERTPAREPALDADPVATIGRELTQSLAAVASSVNLLSPASARLSRLVAVDVIRAEIWRSSCLLEAARVLREDKPVARIRVSPARILEAAGEQMATEARLRGADLDRRIDLSRDVAVRGDENLLAVALSSMLLTTLTFVEGVPHPRLTMSAASQPPGVVVFDVSQEVAVVPSSWAGRAFDPTWFDRPGGLPATIWMLGAQRIAEVLGGQLTLAATDRGTILRLSIPVAAEK